MVDEPRVPYNMLYEILLKSNITEIRKLCRINKEANEIYQTDNFWQNKYINDYNLPNYPVNKWKKEYKLKYIVEHPKKIYKLVYDGRDDDKHIIKMLKVKNRREACKYITYLCNNDLIVDYYIQQLVRQYHDPDFQIEDSHELKILCHEYNNQHKFKYYGLLSLVKVCICFYLKPNYLYYFFGKDTYGMKIHFDLFRYLYSHRFYIDRIEQPYPDQVCRPYFTPFEIERMLNVDCDDDNSAFIELVKDQILL